METNTGPVASGRQISSWVSRFHKELARLCPDLYVLQKFRHTCSCVPFSFFSLVCNVTQKGI